eukprot:TRINITY_DN1683_c0_g2_i1.p1 TRINITY_DN1683_c0_g2~~TRINITY_DN1683_c0_g2_i1.p1  ORF type:complete len:123 (+),score=29.39 TRINITY_DN1683_c0_g2_i1:28-396(+)
MAEAIAQSFVNYYYGQFDAGNRAGLKALYKPSSMLTWESQQILGADAISEKIVGLPFQSVKHRVVSIDAQPSPGNGVLVFVSGELLIDESQNAIRFSQVFNLLPEGDANYWVQNEMFSLNYG